MGNKIPPNASPLTSFAKGAVLAGGTAVAPKANEDETRLVVSGFLAFTAFTKPNVTKLILNTPPNAYMYVRLMLETAGPVAWGQLAGLLPVTSGKGRLLVQNVETRIELPPATRLYLASASPNRVGVTVGPVPYMQEILSALRGKK
jgi:hypothetical protein